jgi:hypothetical protein
LFYGTIPLTAVAFAIDRVGFNRLPHHIALWAPGGMSLIGENYGTQHIVRLLLPAAIAGAMSGGLYSLMVGHAVRYAASEARINLARLGPDLRRGLDMMGYAVLAFFGFLVLDPAYTGARMLWVTVFEPSPGTPPFATMDERDMTARLKIAMVDFPDPASCLDSDAGERGQEVLTRMDWGKIKATPEATVCIFRLLSTYGDISRTREWLEAQGFTVGKSGPYMDLDGTLRVYGNWPIRKNGPKFPRREFFLTAQYMGINATWSPNGKDLLDVEVSFGTK